MGLLNPVARLWGAIQMVVMVVKNKNKKQCLKYKLSSGVLNQQVLKFTYFPIQFRGDLAGRQLSLVWTFNIQCYEPKSSSSICTFTASLCREKQLIYAPKKALVSMKPGSMPSVRKKDALSPEQAVSSHVPGCDAWCGTVAEASVSGKMSQ